MSDAKVIPCPPGLDERTMALWIAYCLVGQPAFETPNPASAAPLGMKAAKAVREIQHELLGLPASTPAG